MLQWMGGSRRKVTASRKSTHNRQKQYFEQRKRQKQTPGQATQENNTDVRNKQTNYHEEPRSLDILSLINLVSVSQQHHSSQENGSEPGTISLDKLSSPFGPQNVPATHRSGGKLDGRKLLVSRGESAFNNTDIKLNQMEEAKNDVSVLDLLSGDEPKSNSEGRSVPEAHVAFSVEGLGKVGIETPPHSPRVHGRNFPSTPKASKRIQPVHRKSIPYDLRQKPVRTLMNSIMHDIKMSQDGSPSESMCNLSGILDDLVNTKKKMFMSLDAYENLTENCNDEEEIFHAYKDCHKEPKWNTRFSVLDENFLDETEYDMLKNNSFHTEGYPSFPSKAKKIESYDNRFGDPFSESSRSVFETCQRYEVSASSSPYFKDSRPQKDHNRVSFDWERPRTGNESSGFGSIFDPPAWPFSAAEDSEDSMSLLSEESCASPAVGFGPHSVKINHRNKHHIGPEKKYVVEKFSADETMYADLDKAPREKSLAGTGNYDGMPDQWNASYCSKYSSELRETFESECNSLYKGLRTPAKVAAGPSSKRGTSIEIDAGFFGYEFMPDDSLFDMFPVPQVYAATDFKNRKSKSKIPDGHDSPMKFIYENELLRKISDPGVQLEKPVTKFPYLSRQQKSGENDEDGFGTVYKPQNKDVTEKKFLPSVNGGSTVIADCKSNCSDHEESRQENQEVFNSPPYKAGETPMAMEEVTTQPASCIDEKIDHCNDSSPFPSQIKNQDSMKEKLEPGRNCGAKGGGNPDASYQVMLESYVLQLLCVQKVLMDSSEKDIKKV